MVMNTKYMPKGYLGCTAGDRCPMADTCLRSLVFKKKMEAGEMDYRLTAVNPYCERLGYATADCLAYNSNEPVRYAFGFKHIFDDVKKGDYEAIRSQVMACFSCESFFYRSQNGSRPIAPEMQKRIAEVLKGHGYGEPEFDRCEELPMWKDVCLA